MLKIQLFISKSGYCSRRGADALVIEGRVKVNNICAMPGQMVDMNSIVTVDDIEVSVDHIDVDTKVILLNKPRNTICSRRDPQERSSVFSLLPVLKGRSWIGVGRLDFNTEGVLLFTNDGKLAHKLMHPSSGIERTYLARTFGKKLEKRDMELIVKQGVKTETATLKPKSLRLMNSTDRHQSYEVVLTGGKNREIHEIFEFFDIVISRLKRVAYGSVNLDNLPKGAYRFLDQDEIDFLMGG